MSLKEDRLDVIDKTLIEKYYGRWINKKESPNKTIKFEVPISKKNVKKEEEKIVINFNGFKDNINKIQFTKEI